MTTYRLIAEPEADADVEAAFEWYEQEEPGLGLEFLEELSDTDDPDPFPRPGIARPP